MGGTFVNEASGKGLISKTYTALAAQYQEQSNTKNGWKTEADIFPKERYTDDQQTHGKCWISLSIREHIGPEWPLLKKIYKQ